MCDVYESKLISITYLIQSFQEHNIFIYLNNSFEDLNICRMDFEILFADFSSKLSNFILYF